jgi:hypothetical protein
VCCSQVHIGISITVPKSVPRCDPTLAQTCPIPTKTNPSFTFSRAYVLRQS